jgi:hypothetical protein
MAITTPGAVDYHLASQTGSLSINPLLANSLMVWLNATTWTGGLTNSMVGAYNSATSGGTAIQIGTRLGTGNCDVWTWGANVLVSSSGGTGITTLSNNIWYHIAYTFDGTTHRLYINGVQTNTGTAGQLSGTITSIFINGYPTGGANETGTFSVDDISYFNRTLSADEILTAYTTAGSRDGIVYGATASCLVNEGTAGTVANNCLDYTGKGNSLTPIGAAVGVNFVYAPSYITTDTRPSL